MASLGMRKSRKKLEELKHSFFKWKESRPYFSHSVKKLEYHWACQFGSDYFGPRRKMLPYFDQWKSAYWGALHIKMIGTIPRDPWFTSKIKRGFICTGCFLPHTNGKSQKNTRLGRHSGDVQGIFNPWTWHLRLNDFSYL